MKKVMIIGAGAQGNVISGVLSQAEDVGTILLGDVDLERANEVAALRLGLDLGMTLIDTAEMYAEGGAEEVTGEVIKGWDNTVKGMEVGDETTVVIPPDDAYGSQGREGVDPDTPLKFWMKILAVSPSDTSDAFSTSDTSDAFSTSDTSDAFSTSGGCGCG